MRNLAIVSTLVFCLVACGGGGGSVVGGSTGSTDPNGDLQGRRIFPVDDPWNTRIDTEPVDPNSANLIASIGLTGSLHPDFGANWNGGPFGIPYVIVEGTQKKVNVAFDYADESDPGPYPIPSDAPIEGGANSSGDRHVLVIDKDNWTLYELYAAYPQRDGTWTAGSGAIFDMTNGTTRPAGWTSADAAGLPILPGLVRFDEVSKGAINHALRFTVAQTRHAYVAPARHYASSSTDPDRPPMGMRVRLKASFDISGYPASAQVILTALKKYGMFVADNGSNWYVSGAPDARWNDDELNTLKQVKGSDFEVVQMGPITTN
ncbi:MAG: hypothetical protein JST51_07650 [Armatimonadetes bacterium]|nr:hypothetical protein [Armatimonadota bacterium]